MQEPVSSYNPDQFPQSDDVEIPPDPLLRSDTFIQVEDNHHHSVQNGADDEEVQTPKPIRAVRAGSEPEKATDTPSTQRKPKRQPEELAERPRWLPEDWKMELRVRTSGATAGSVDRYYVEPTTGRKFRSKNEVTYFITYGGKRKKKNENESPGVSESPGSQKSVKKSKAKIGDFTKLNFDFKKPPQKLTWSLTSASQDKWMPLVNEGGGILSEAVKRDWDNAFNAISLLEGRSR